jgi:hypothetical protein
MDVMAEKQRYEAQQASAKAKRLVARACALHAAQRTRVYMPSESHRYTLADAQRDQRALDRKALRARRALLAYIQQLEDTIDALAPRRSTP